MLSQVTHIYELLVLILTAVYNRVNQYLFCQNSYKSFNLSILTKHLEHNSQMNSGMDQRMNINF